jgi:OmpA-OmpF porin, OOP family
MRYLLLSAVLFSSAAFAEEGSYARFNVGRVSVDQLGLKDSHSSLGLDVGYRFTENYGAELGYHDFGDFSSSAGAPIKNSINADSFTMALSAKYALHTGEFQGFYVDGRLGLANFTVKGSTYSAAQQSGQNAVRSKVSNSKLFLGLGAGYDMTKNFSMGISYTRFEGQTTLFQGSTGIALKNETLRFPEIAFAAEFRF